MNIESLHTQIKKSIQDGSLTEVKEWIKKGADINHIDDGFMCKTKGYTLLHWAITAENFEIFSYLVEKEANYKNKVPKVGILLDFCVRTTNLKIISYLLQLDFTDNEKKDFIEKSIFHAGICGNFKKIEYLVKEEYKKSSPDLLSSLKKLAPRKTIPDSYSFNINTKDKFGETILHHIAEKENAIETIKLLIGKGINIEHKGDRGWTALDYAIDNKNIGTISYLKKIGAKGDISKTTNEISLYDAIKEDDLPYLQNYIENGGNINIKISSTKHLKSPLLIIAINNNSHLISNFLIDSGVDTSLMDEPFNSSALWYAATQDNLEIVKKLIKKGDDINSVGGGPEEGSGTILISAVFYGNKEVVQYLLEAGASINETDEHGRTALHIARYEENDEIENLLLLHGPDLEIIDNYGVKALEI